MANFWVITGNNPPRQLNSESVIGSLALLHLTRLAIITAKGTRGKTEQDSRQLSVPGEQGQGLREELREKAWRGETNQRDPCCFFFVMQMCRHFAADGVQGAHRGRKKNKNLHHCVVLEQRFPFMRQQNCVCVCLQIKMISGVEVRETSAESMAAVLYVFVADV